MAIAAGALLAAVTAMSLAGCASSRTAPRVTFLGDGVLKAPNAEEAEAYCRNFGAPMRFVGNARAQQAAPGSEVTFRCD